MLVEEVKDILKPEEGYRRYLYKDSRGYWSIGYGLCIEEGIGEGLTESDADYLLGVSVRRRIEALEKLCGFWPRLPTDAQKVLVCMTYQLGLNGTMKFRKFLEALSVGDWQLAHDEMLNSAWARQTPERANRMADMILGLSTQGNGDA